MVTIVLIFNSLCAKFLDFIILHRDHPSIVGGVVAGERSVEHVISRPKGLGHEGLLLPAAAHADGVGVPLAHPDPELPELIHAQYPRGVLVEGVNI